MKYEELVDIFRTIDADNDLSESNVLKKISERLEVTYQDEHQKWKEADFDINYCFKVEGDNQSLEISLFTILFCLKQYTKTLNALVKYSANNGLEVLDFFHFVALSDSVEIAKTLVKKGINVNEKCKYVTLPGLYGSTPLHFAVMAKNMEMIKFLIANGADPLLENDYGMTPEYFAEGNIEIEVLLRKKDSTVTQTTEENTKPSDDTLQQQRRTENNDLKANLLESENKSKQLETQVKTLIENERVLESQIQSPKKQLKSRNEDLKQRTTENNDLKTKLQESESKSKGLESRVENLQKQLESKNKELNGKNEKFSRVSTHSKRQGNYASVSFLLSGVLAVGASLAIPYLAICISLAVAALTFLTVGCYCLYKANTALSNVEVDNCVSPAVVEV